MRDLNFFSKYHVAPVKTSPVRLAVIAGGTVLTLVMFFTSFYLYLSNVRYQKRIEETENILKSREISDELKEVSDTEKNIATVINDQVLFTTLEGDFKRLHRVNKAFMSFIQGRITRNLVFNTIEIDYDFVKISGSSRERLSIAKFEEELRKTEKFNHIIVSDIVNSNGGGAATHVARDDKLKDVYNFTIEIVTKDVDFNEE